MRQRRWFCGANFVRKEEYIFMKTRNSKRKQKKKYTKEQFEIYKIVLEILKIIIDEARKFFQ